MGKNKNLSLTLLNAHTVSSPQVIQGKDNVLFICNQTGLPQLWSWDAQSMESKKLVALADRVMSVHPSPTGEVTVVGMDRDGNEKKQLYLLHNETLHVEELVVSPQHLHHFGGWSACGTKVIWSSNRRNPAWFEIYVQDIITKKIEMVYEYEGRCTPVCWLPGNQQIIFKQSEASEIQTLYVLDLGTGSQHKIGGEGKGRYRSVQMTKGGSLGYMLTDVDTNTMGLYRFTPDHPSLTPLVIDSQWDLVEARLSPDESRLAYAVNEGGIYSLYSYDIAADKSTKVDRIPRGVVASLRWFDNEQLIMVLKSPSLSGDLFRYDLRQNVLQRMTHFGQSAQIESLLREPELRSFTSFDQLEVPYFYYRQDREQAPVVIYVHGGPASQIKFDYNPVIQYLVANGFAVVAPNVRGSSGYGKQYMQLDDKRKRMDSVKDLAWLVKDLATITPVNENNLFIMGRSYGGFMVLAALTQYPDLWAGGVDIVGISHFRTFLENTGPWRRKLREAEYGTLAEDSDFFEEIAPLNLSHNIKAPLLMMHGRNDSRVPVSEAEQLYADMLARGQAVELVVFEDEGHTTEKIENKIRTNETILDFFQRQLRN